MPYLRGLPNAILQQDNSMSHVVRHVLIFFDILLPARFPDLSPIENIWLWIAERLDRHLSTLNTVDGVWHCLEASWDELPVSAIQAQFTPCLTR